MLLQVIVAIAAAGGAILFSLRKKIAALFSKDKKIDNVNQPRPKAGTSDDDVIDTLPDEE